MIIVSSNFFDCAGLPEDLKTIAVCSFYGMSVITAVIIQNIMSISSIYVIF
ncbi:MAG: bifunctional hydroxymethylpyrimidine kinase/phosphomethylpyrimidine kinase [Lachnospiraceae bacterium]|nr:bifunctional hydroxymethylpyrimidine kinase/phosphomethylpyrimidine kinase [Lachnospiraceae bacterium]